MLGVQTPLQSGRPASADQSFAWGGGLMTVPAMAAGACTASPTSAVAATLHLRAVNGIANPQVGALMVNPIHRPHAATAIQSASDSPPTSRARSGVNAAVCHEAAPRPTTR